MQIKLKKVKTARCHICESGIDPEELVFEIRFMRHTHNVFHIKCALSLQNQFEEFIRLSKNI